MNNEIIIVNEKILKDKIYHVRGQQVMLDFDLAAIYGYSVSAFNQQVKRNEERFTEDFMFKLLPEELPLSLKSQNVILNKVGNKRGLHIKKMPNAFTEQGIYMLMTILKGELAIKQSQALIRLFKNMKDYLTETSQLSLINNDIYRNDIILLQNKTLLLNERVTDIENNMISKNDLSDIIRLFNNSLDNQEILILDNQPFKADVAYQNIYLKARKNIIIIDDYISIKTLQHLSCIKKKIDITIISDNKARNYLLLSQYNDFVREYPDIKINFIKSDNLVHDRYIVIDYSSNKMKLYLSGSSLKDSGNKITTITQIKGVSEFSSIIKRLLNNQILVLK